TKGVGLGMAFVKAVMERHAGEIRVRSAAWQGTTVTLALPAVEAG
ncbi:MAG: ATP-binding protein, partial [Paraburkholderia tropica]